MLYSSYTSIEFFKDTRNDTEAWQAIEDKATEKGFNLGIKVDWDTIWIDATGREVYQRTLRQDNKCLQIILRSSYKMLISHNKNRMLTINND